jgi:hypothetical protein
MIIVLRANITMVEVDLCVQIGPSDRYSHVVFFLL